MTNTDTKANTGTRILTVSLISTTNNYNYGRKTTNVPYIRLQGKWLEKQGFNIGDKISVVADGNDVLKLRVLREEEL